ncbi:teicoplanin resistance protein VanJ [Streptomyces sp. A7024]|uniref:Teicoplanin resistance protein VanJ n=1 Tax=Streptomyces coryli TaxID=1128680 RepID=A0A6G4TX24_9ACTN|nr:endonuclease/exonuclease/phosphatase family protein [Streptomyces coryli]NGN64070.1 teicoplanin resistance protein VanJ [Streptomyces coryli]
MAGVDTAPAGQDTAGRPEAGPWKRGLVLAGLAVLLGLFLLLHAKIPNRIGNLGSLVETFLPWFGLCIPVLLAAGIWRRSAAAVVALLLPAVVWAGLFGGLLSDKSQSGADLTVVSHNVAAENSDPAGTARDLAASGAQVLALQEVSEAARGTYEKALAKAYPHHAVLGTVGVWSKLPLSGTEAVDIAQDVGPLADTKSEAARMVGQRALRTTVATDQGSLTVYVAHLGSVRVNPRDGFSTGGRDRNVQALSAAIAADKSERVVLLGDLNGTLDDRTFAGLTAQLHSAQEAAGNGFGFTWPAKAPMARIDQILVRGVEPKSSWVLPATGSDHRPVAAGISW